MTIVEEWRPIGAFPSYSVSNGGQIKHVHTGRGARAGQLLKQRVNRDGYLCVTLQTRERRKGYLVSRLVCEAFSGPPPSPAYQAAHRDGVKTNNHATNLRWATDGQNTADKFAHGTVLRGEAHSLSKLTDAQVKTIRSDQRSQRTVAAEYGVTQSLISQVKLGKIWGHVG